MTHICFATISLLAVILWVPLGVRFFFAWRERRNPVSLAICCLIAYTIYVMSMHHVALHTNTLSSSVVERVASCFSLTICLYFYISFRWSRKRFPDARHK